MTTPTPKDVHEAAGSMGPAELTERYEAVFAEDPVDDAGELTQLQAGYDILAEALQDRL